MSAGIARIGKKRKSDRERRRPPIREGRIEFSQAVKRTDPGSPLDKSAPEMVLAAAPPCANSDRGAN